MAIPRLRSNSLTDDFFIRPDTPLIFEISDQIFSDSPEISAPTPTATATPAPKAPSNAGDKLRAILGIITDGEYGKLPLISVDPAMTRQLCAPRLFRGMEGISLMHIAVYHDHEEAVHWLFSKGCGPNVYTSRGCTPLQMACVLQNVKAAKALLSLPATCLYASSMYGRTALMSAVHVGNMELVNAFLDHPSYEAGKLLNASDSERTSVLEWAHLGRCGIGKSGTTITTPGQKYSNAHDAVITRLLDFSASITPDPEFLVRLFVNDRLRFDRLAVAFPGYCARALKMIDVDLLQVAAVTRNGTGSPISGDDLPEEAQSAEETNQLTN